MKLLSENLFEFKKGLDPIDSLGLSRKTMIEDWLNKMGIDKYTIDEDYNIALENNYKLFQIIDKQFVNEEFPDFIKFKDPFKANFRISNTNLKSFKNFPKIINGYLSIVNCNIESLIGIPALHCEPIYGYCLVNNNIKNFKGLPDIIMCSLWIDHNPLDSLDGFPSQIFGDLILPKNFCINNINTIQKICNVGGNITFA